MINHILPQFVFIFFIFFHYFLMINIQKYYCLYSYSYDYFQYILCNALQPLQPLKRIQYICYNYPFPLICSYSIFSSFLLSLCYIFLYSNVFFSVLSLLNPTFFQQMYSLIFFVPGPWLSYNIISYSISMCIYAHMLLIKCICVLFIIFYSCLFVVIYYQ